MIIRIILGVVFGYLLIAYFPLVLRFLPYATPVILVLAAAYCLRAAPMIAEPLGYGLLAVLICYILYMLIFYKKYKDKLKPLKTIKNVTLPIVKINNFPRLSVFATLVVYTLALTFAFYMMILLIYVR
ncbi:MAG: hypothetical protein ILA52_00280 [Alphaproteobacteria bacterium]|nr:hypothetical protein [Alphaproteobacteria bacterium]